MHLLQKCSQLSFRFCCLKRSEFSKIPVITVNNSRMFSFSGTKQLNWLRLEGKYRVIGEMSSSASLIYYNPSANWLKVYYHSFNLAIIIAVLSITKVGQQYINNEISFPIYVDDTVLVGSMTELVLGALFALSSLIIARAYCRHSVLRMYYNEAANLSKAILVSNVPTIKRVINIKSKTAYPVETKFPIKISGSVILQVDNNRIFVQEEYFRSPEDMNRLLKENIEK